MKIKHFLAVAVLALGMASCGGGSAESYAQKTADLAAEAQEVQNSGDIEKAMKLAGEAIDLGKEVDQAIKDGKFTEQEYLEALSKIEK